MRSKEGDVNTFNTFNDLQLPQALAKSLGKMNFLAPTPIQQRSIPFALEGKDILGTAQTGTGKTGAFGIPLLTNLYSEPTKQALILCPTRELAAQINQVLRQMGKGLGMYGSLVVGGESFRRQRDELERGADYIVATPGRLNDHLQEGTVDLSGVNFLVLDEVDRMLDMGFAPQIKEIMKHVSKERQTLLFSATLPNEIQGLAQQLLKNPVRVAIDTEIKPSAQVEQKTIEVSMDGKNGLILKELEERQGKVLIFARTQIRTDRLATLLYREGHKVVRLHGGCTQWQRKDALDKFRRGSHPIMVATDLAGRGIDVTDIEHVINFDLPETHEDYIHRIGRTGRFGRTGNALSFVTPVDTDAERIITGVKPKPKFAFRGGRRFGGRGRGPSRRF
ncbi:MAG: DEAD/DEAH box helicase [Deltaproteobacteria bacterium]|nr:DEAD/DEAH box helicase [Deltaproteobacteria bacterium]